MVDIKRAQGLVTKPYSYPHDPTSQSNQVVTRLSYVVAVR
jgi:hypothetical protein